MPCLVKKELNVELTDISKNLQNAVIATEDRSFYKNDGINYGRFFLAIVTAGRSGGGSTITQQLAKNAYLSQDQTVERKAKEFFLALELTKKYSKDQILTMYLNNAYLEMVCGVLKMRVRNTLEFLHRK